MPDPPLYTLRPHGRSVQSATLEGAFRIHIHPKELRELSLEQGDLCQLVAQGAAVGLACAWSLPTNDPQNNSSKRVVKITDTAKDVFGVTYQDRVTITKSNEQLRHAERVVIADVTQDVPPITTEGREEVEYWACHALARLEVLVSGGSFEVVPRRGPQRGPRRRFLIEKIEPSSGADTSMTAYYYFDFKSRVQIQEVLGLPATPTDAPRRLEIQSHGIGGLHKQLLQLNKRIAALSDDARNNRIPLQLRRSGGVLLYGPEGTGKSLLLSRIADAPWAKVFQVDDSIVGPYVGQSQTALRKIFADAVSYQPSVILMDQLETLAGKVDRGESLAASLTTTLARELDKLKGSKVLVVGATNRPNDIDKSLRTPARFRYEIELPVPDANARIEILKVIQHKDRFHPDGVSEAIGEKTHGFVGQDLEALYETALEKATDRYCATDDYIHVHASGEDLSNLDGCTETEERSYSPVDETHGFEVTVSDFESALLEVRPTAMREVFLETPKVKWADIGGSDDVKKALYKVTERPFKRPDIMHDLDLEPQRGILLYGPPGCSKTLTAKAVATEAGLNFIAVKGAELTSMYVGESERAIREVFRKARNASPSIIFFDEIDAIAVTRGPGPHTSGLNVLTTLLNEMDGIETLKGVLVLAATNKPEILDPALLRPGRFDTMLYIGPPNRAARHDILRIRTRRMPLADDVDFDAVAEKTEGCSGAEIVRICVEAAEATADDREIDNTHEKISQRHFDTALSKVPRQITPAMITAYEEFNIGGLMKL